MAPDNIHPFQATIDIRVARHRRHAAFGAAHASQSAQDFNVDKIPPTSMGISVCAAPRSPFAQWGDLFSCRWAGFLQ
eukprot:15474056-Alexandrium_andersonii.AAC.1